MCVALRQYDLNKDIAQLLERGIRGETRITSPQQPTQKSQRFFHNHSQTHGRHLQETL